MSPKIAFSLRHVQPLLPLAAYTSILPSFHGITAYNTLVERVSVKAGLRNGLDYGLDQLSSFLEVSYYIEPLHIPD